MAKKYSDAKGKKLKSLLTNSESKAVDDVEAYIDDQIDLQWESGMVIIDLCVMTFECNPITKAPISYPEPKRVIMQDLLFTRFKEAEWVLTQDVNIGKCLFVRKNLF